MEEENSLKIISKDVKLGKKVKIQNFVNLYGCEIGNETKIGPFVEIQKGAKIGRRCKISSHTFICEGVTIEDEVFIGHNVTFINDKYPHATTSEGKLQTESDWKVIPIAVRKKASIGSSATILCGVEVGENSIVGAGSVVIKDVPSHTIVAGTPAKVIKKMLKIKGDHFMHVPFLDLKRQYDQIEEEINDRFSDILETQHFIQGEYVQEFEKKFANYCDSKYCIAVNSGTSALYLVLIANGIGYKDEVITVPNTFIATAEAISMCGATPVFVDINERTYNIDVEKIDAAITKKTKAIIPVHLYGQCADINRINEVAEKYDLKVIEDACQAHGAEYKGKKTGALGIAAAFSFYPGKNLGAYGDAGAVVTNNEYIAEMIKLLRDHGSKEKYYHEVIGGNFRMNAFQGAVLGVKLKLLDAWNKQRKVKAKKYSENLSELEFLDLPSEAEYNKHVYHLYVIKAKNRDNLREFLARKNIGTGIHYPIPIHLQKAYNWLMVKKGSFPISEKVAEEILSLPMFPELSSEEIEHVSNTLLDAKSLHNL